MPDEVKPVAPAAPAQPAVQFDDNTMIPVPLADGRMGMEPLKNVRANLAAASQMRAAAAQYEARRQDLEFVDTLRTDYVEDPKRALGKVKRMLGVEDEPAADADADPTEREVKRLRAELNTLKGVVTHTTTEGKRERAVRDAREAVEAYPAFATSNTDPLATRAREKAIRNVIIAKSAGDTRTIKEIAAEEHADYYEFAVGKTTAAAKALEAKAAEQQPVLPQGQGAPTVSTRPKMTVKEAMTGGGIERIFAEGMEKGSLAALGFRANVNNRRT